jgi:exopolyphosphatase/guanosine-5'-triphosphate,3'-diphosphate pyrophosphatase
VRLLIGGILERQDHPVIKKIQLVRVPVRLGEDVFDSGRVGHDKRDHLIKTIKAFRLLLDVYGVNYYRTCATSAMREALNRTEVVARVEVETGIDIEVIDGHAEADLITNTFWTQDLLKDRSYLYIDVGGGSTQLTWLRNGRRVKSESFRIGAVRMLKEKVDPAEWDRVNAFLVEVHDAADGLMGIGTGTAIVSASRSAASTSRSSAIASPRSAWRTA